MAIHLDRTQARERGLYAAGLELYEAAALVDAYVRNGRQPSGEEAAALTVAVLGYQDALRGRRPEVAP